MGQTGVGKSSFIKLLDGKDLHGQAPEVSDELESCNIPLFLELTVPHRILECLTMYGYFRYTNPYDLHDKAQKQSHTLTRHTWI